MDLQTPVASVSRSYKLYAGRLEILGITTLEDFLYHFPFRYEDFSLISKIGQVQPGETVTIKAQVLKIANEFTRSFKKVQKATIADDSGSIEIIWFNQPYIAKYIRTNDTLSVSGKIEWFNRTKVLMPMQYEILTDAESTTIHTGRLVPIYPETRGVSSKWLRRQIWSLLSQYEKQLIDYLPEDKRKEWDLTTLPQAIKQIHFPDTLEDVKKARTRLAFDELLLMQMQGLQKRKDWQTKEKSNPFVLNKFNTHITNFFESLPFSLTKSQHSATEDILKDLQRKQPMNRLLQGDVGSGKTVVGTTAMYLAFLNGFQSVLMAPTEILAQQHYKTVSDLLTPLGVKVELKTGSTKKKRKNDDMQNTKTKDKKSKENSSFDILIGTHAVLYETVGFDRLGLVIIDEQQRFGVMQRSMIRQRGRNPHLLTMTATPIPRTAALALYGDLDLSYLDEMPKGRKIIKTWLVPPEKRDGAYNWIRKQIKETDSQVFIICPFIEPSENMQTVKAAAQEFTILQKDIFPDLKLSLLHGKQKIKEKETVLADFKDKKADILVATPVVEVGIDIPNATIMLIEASERFGLAQLHQLRGRVGRGDKQSYCLLFTESKNPQTLEKLKALEIIHNGQELAELDLKLRGPGEMYGTAQSGVSALKIASLSDSGLVAKTQKAAKELFTNIDSFEQLQKKLAEKNTKLISPD